MARNVSILPRAGSRQPTRQRGPKVAALAALLIAAACSAGEKARNDAATRGRQIYENVCIACHNGDPTQPGSLGPELAGATRELIEARVMHAAYPPGYTPRRPTQAMPKYEYLKDRIDDLAAYLGPLQKN
jgi:mono/diheme cytochrome c family protein